MYIARLNIRGRIRYIIRESVLEPGGEYFVSHDLFDLGVDPAEFIHYFGRNSFHIDPGVEEIVEQQRILPGGSDLEDLFEPFLKPEARRQAEFFSHKYRNFTPRKLSAGDLAYLNRRAHIFDRKRLHYLRYGSLSQARLHQAPPKMFLPLLDKSRDELEQYFLTQEKVLEPTELRQYVYVIFDLQRFFIEAAAQIMPDALDQGRLDELFELELCHLCDEQSFSTGLSVRALGGYLGRYAIMFFDYGFPASSFDKDYVRQFINGHRAFSFPKKELAIDEQETRDLFGVGKDELEKMSKSSLTVLYRQLAHEHHPDKGGEHDDFVRLTEFYQQILKNKK